LKATIFILRISYNGNLILLGFGIKKEGKENPHTTKDSRGITWGVGEY